MLLKTCGIYDSKNKIKKKRELNSSLISNSVTTHRNVDDPISIIERAQIKNQSEIQLDPFPSFLMSVAWLFLLKMLENRIF